MKKINILVADDYPIPRKGLAGMLGKKPFVEATFEAYDEMSVMHVLNCHAIEVVVMDMQLRGITGLELFKKLKGLAKRPYVIGITALDGEDVIINLLRSGMEGVVHKLDQYDEMIRAINIVMGGGRYVTWQVRKHLRKSPSHWRETPSVIPSFMAKEYLKALASGLTNKEIAPLLKMTEKSAEKFRLRLMKKMGVSNSAALVAFAFRNGML